MPDPSPVEYLYETPDTGKLQISPEGAAYRQKDQEESDGPSLSGLIPRYGYKGQQGLAGSLTEYTPKTKAPTEGPYGAPTGPGAPPKPLPHQMTPEELIAWADRQQADIAEQTAASLAQGPSVQLPIDQRSPPAWLQQYMDTQPPTTPYAFGGTNVVDRVMGNKYLTEQEKLRYLRDLQRDKGLKP